MSVPFWQLLALFGWLVFTFARYEAFWWVIPTPSAIDRLADVFVTGLEDVNRYATPVAPFRGLVARQSRGIGLCHIAVDTLAVTWRRPAVAGLPLLALYCVPSALAPGGVGWGWFVLGAGGWLALLVADARLRFTTWGRPLGYGRGDRASEREYAGEIRDHPVERPRSANWRGLARHCGHRADLVSRPRRERVRSRGRQWRGRRTGQCHRAEPDGRSAARPESSGRPHRHPLHHRRSATGLPAPGDARQLRRHRVGTRNLRYSARQPRARPGAPGPGRTQRCRGQRASHDPGACLRPGRLVATDAVPAATGAH